MPDEVNLVGSRVSRMHVVYDCLRCKQPITVSIIDGGKDEIGHEYLTQEPRNCPNCGESLLINIVAEPSATR
jgi:DNA-directed RNA polymerase subunit RPC12/RpoP